MPDKVQLPSGELVLPEGIDVRKIAEEVLERNGVVHEMRENMRSGVRSSLKISHKEKLLQLRPRSLVINPHDPEHSPDFLEVKRIYKAREVSTAAFEALTNEESHRYKAEVAGGGMLNNFDPSPTARKEYERDNPRYESVKEQIISDMLGTSGRPGKYFMRGLFDPQNNLRAYASGRIPPKRPDDSSQMPEYRREMSRYIKHLKNVLFNEHMTYVGKWNQREMKKQLATTAELDTINVDRDWEKAGNIALWDMLSYIHKELGYIPSFFGYLFEGLHCEEEDSLSLNSDEPEGVNIASYLFTNSLGFKPMAYKYNPHEVVVREIRENYYVPFQITWRYVHNGPNRLQRHLRHKLQHMGILEKDEELYLYDEEALQQMMSDEYSQKAN